MNVTFSEWTSELCVEKGLRCSLKGSNKGTKAHIFDACQNERKGIMMFMNGALEAAQTGEASLVCLFLSLSVSSYKSNSGE